MRDREWRRKKDFSKAIRKRKIDLHNYWWGFYNNVYSNPLDFSVKRGFYNNLHQYSKNKIHCSCSMCSRKTRNKGKRRYKAGNYSRSLCYKASDLRKLISMDEKEKSYFGTDMPRRRVHNW